MSLNETKASGFKELDHIVRKGETVSQIAAAYRSKGWPVKSWEPIYDVTRLKTGLWDRKGTGAQRYNPNLIYPGDVLIIPRSPAGYDRRIGELQRLAESINKSSDSVPDIRKQAEDFGAKIDLLSDVLQFIALCGLNAGAAAKASKAAKKAVGNELAEQLAKKSKALSALSDRVREFAFTKSAEWVGGAKVGTALKVGGSVKKGGDLSRAIKAVKGAKDVGLGIARGADMILDYISPSEIAKLYLYLRTGEKVDDTLFQAEYREVQSKVMTLKALGDRIAALRAEKAYLYANGVAPNRKD